jgi:hypothetical protein
MFLPIIQSHANHSAWMQFRQIQQQQHIPNQKKNNEENDSVLTRE